MIVCRDDGGSVKEALFISLFIPAPPHGPRFLQDKGQFFNLRCLWSITSILVINAVTVPLRYGCRLLMKHGFVDKVKWIDTLMSVCPPVDFLEFVTLCK